MNRLIAMVLGIVFLSALLMPRPGAREAERAAASAESDSTAPHRRQRAVAVDETVLERDSSGQFHVDAAVNGQDTRFLVDTGADVVALTEEEAERLGLGLSRRDFRPMMETASGVGYGAPVVLDRIEIGQSEFRDVDAVVVEGLGTNLLGQSVLRRLGRVDLQGDRMVLSHY